MGSRTVYRNAWMEVREDEVERLDGTLGVYGVVDKPDCALIIPVDDGFHLVEQYRYPVGRRQWEFPQGSWASAATPMEFSGNVQDATIDEDALALARAELREETGLDAAQWTMLGRVNVAHGYSSQGCVVFVASDLRRGRPAREATELDMRQSWVTRAELDDMIRRGEFVDSLSLSALALFERSLRSADGSR